MTKKKTLSLLFALIVGALLLAQGNSEGFDVYSADLIDLDRFDLPIATTDNLFAPLVNPALLGTGKSSGLGWIHLWNEKKVQNHYWIAANLGQTAYLYEYNDGISYHRISNGFEVFPNHVLPNLYAGTSYAWRNSDWKEGGWRNSIVYRPHNSTSLAMRWDNPYKGSPEYRFGLGLRPLAFIPAVPNWRLEMSLDLPYAKSRPGDSTKAADGYEIMKPSIGINTQLINGINLGGTYNMESETVMLTFILSAGKSRIGTVAHAKENDNFGVAYVHLSDQQFLPFAGLATSRWYEMKLRGEVVTYRAPRFKVGPFQIFDSGQRSVESIIDDIGRAGGQPGIKGIVFVNPSFSASFALRQEIVTALKNFKNTGRSIVFYYDNMSNADYVFAASVADRIYLNPKGVVDLRGLAVNAPYVGEALTAIGIEVMNFRSHPYKTGGNMLSESEMTPAERETYEALLGSLYSQMIDTISQGRDLTRAEVEQLIDNGPYFDPQDALDKGLIDGLIYQDELKDKLKAEYKVSRRSRELLDYMNYEWSQPRENMIAVIYAQGNIVMGSGTVGQKIAHKTTVDIIRRVRNDKRYKGIILRIDSGGGSAQASDIILREIDKARTENKLPVVVSMSSVAGSGGYYIACRADKIVADPATITGSIGVIGITFNAERLFRKIRLNWSTVKKGERSDFGTINRAWTDAEKEILRRYIEITYEDFVREVAEGRNMSVEDVHEIAQGKVFTAEDALKLGLVDHLGGLDTALEVMRELTGIKGKITMVDATSSAKGIAVGFSGSPLLKPPSLQMLEELSQEYVRLYELWKDFAGEKALMLMPETISATTFE